MKILETNILRNEKGMALVLAMVMLVLLTLIGFAAVNNTTTEVALSGNYRLATDSFYVSEAGMNSIILNDTNLPGTGTGPTWSTPVTVGTKTATVTTQYLQNVSLPPGSGTGVHTASAAAEYLIKSTGISASGKSVQEAVVAKILPSS